LAAPSATRQAYPRCWAVVVVLTERKSRLTEARSRNYERLRERVADASGETVEVAHYEDVEPSQLGRASSVVLSGSSAPWSAHDPAALERLGDAVRSAGRPVLGICAGMQLQAVFAGGAIGPSRAGEHGYLPIQVHDSSDLLRGLPPAPLVFHDHDDEVVDVPAEFRVLASSADCAVQAIADPTRRWWGTQFHPEEFRPEDPAGEQILRTFFALAS
jgi:GMP synthase (glutamine-hydrolysing)